MSAEPVFSSKTLAAFLSLVFSQPAAVVVDLGPVIGSNITFLAQRVGCKIHVEDLYADLDRHAQQGALDRSPEFLGGRFALLGFFGAGRPEDMRYTKSFIEDEAHLRRRFSATACSRRWVLQNREINNLFAGLELFDSVLLKSGVRKILFRKPAVS